MPTLPAVVVSVASIIFVVFLSVIGLFVGTFLLVAIVGMVAGWRSWKLPLAAAGIAAVACAVFLQVFHYPFGWLP
jgi:hypothetical protein